MKANAFTNWPRESSEISTQKYFPAALFLPRTTLEGLAEQDNIQRLMGVALEFESVWGNESSQAAGERGHEAVVLQGELPPEAAVPLPDRAL